ncbi:MAG TPA: vWA domain-containing protein [Bacilli bacterium]
MMKAKRHVVKTCFAFFAALLLIGTLFPAASAESAEAAGCLNLTGSVADGQLDIYMNDTMELAFTVTPGGSYTTSVQRPPADISLVLDVSGSMDFSNEDGRLTPTRMDSLQDASKHLLDKLASVHLGDRVGIIKFSYDAEKVADLTTNYTYLKEKIDRLRANGSTNIDYGLTLAHEMLKKSENSKKIVILVTDGYANAYVTDSGKIRTNSLKTARQEAEYSALRLKGDGAVVYTVALGKAGASDVDHELLENIANSTNGVKYDASSTEDLESVFDSITRQIQQDGALSSIVISEPLPPGFILADGNPPEVSEENGKLLIRLADIAYPFDENPEQTITVKLKQSNFSGEYGFADATLSYLDACAVQQTGTIPVNVTVSVVGSVTDIYGNRYVGSGTGEVTRYRLGDMSKPQWRIKAVNSPVTSITFDDPENTIVRVGYQNGDVRVFDLKPSAPDVTVTDNHGAAIAATDAGWHQGPAAIAAENSHNRLPADTEYLNDDFTANYITGYQYRTKQADGTWGNWFVVSSLNNITESRQNLEIQAAALTDAISGDPNILFGGEAATRTVSLDGVKPEVPTVTASFLPVYKKYRYEVTNVDDAHSGVTTNASGEKTFTLSINGASSTKSASDNSFAATDADISAGNVTITVTDNVGNSLTKTVTEKPVDGTGPAIVFDPNAVANPATDPTLEVKAQENTSFVYAVHIYVDGVEVPITQKAPAQSVAYSFQLSQAIPDNAGLSDPKSPRYGWHQLRVQAENVAGEISEKSFAFKVNPGPYAELSVSDTGVSDEPVTVSLVNVRDIPVPAKKIGGVDKPAVKVTQMYYEIVPDSPLSDPEGHTFTKKLGAKQLKVSAAGTNYVYVMLVDEDGNKFVTEPAVVKIDYNQKKY